MNNEITWEFDDFSANSEYKSDLFSLLMQVKEYALQTYNAVNGSDYDNPEELQIVTLEHGISMTIRNDASFIFDMSANYYEHQSTYNPNMPLRNLIYCVEDIRRWIRAKRRNLYGSSRIKIPSPHFVVFYNGERSRPEIEYQKLSEAFWKPEAEPELELICKVININPGNNVEMMKKATILSEYTELIELVRMNLRQDMLLKDAIHRAIDECIRRGVLAGFLEKNREEVEKMMNLDFTFERQLELTAEEEYAAGYEAGKKEEKARADAAEKRAEAAEAEISRLQKLLSQK